MPNTPVFPQDSILLRKIPVFTHEGLKTARVSVLPTIESMGAGSEFVPAGAVEVDFGSAMAYTKSLRCDPREFQKTGGLDGDPRLMILNDTMSRFSVTLTDVIAISRPQGNFSVPPQSALAPNIEFEFRASTADSPGDPRWGGILNFTNVLTYTGMAGFLGKTGGIHATRWEVWARIDPSGAGNNVGPVQMMVHMSVDRLGDVNQNVYGNVVDPVL